MASRKRKLRSVAPVQKSANTKFAERFYALLKKKYPVNISYEIKYYDQELFYLESFKDTTGGYVSANFKTGAITMHIPTAGYIFEVYEAIAHEHKHILQIQDGTWTEGGTFPFDHPLELEARQFAKQVMVEYEAGKLLKAELARREAEKEKAWLLGAEIVARFKALPPELKAELLIE